MSTITLSSQKGLSSSAALAAPRKPFLARLYEAIISAQTAKAERQLALYVQRTGHDPRK